MGPLNASISDWTGHATFSVQHAGERLRGEASRMQAGYPGYGRVYRAVYAAAYQLYSAASSLSDLADRNGLKNRNNKKILYS